MFFKILLVTVAVGFSQAAEYNSDTSRSSSNYATPSPSPYAPEPTYTPYSNSNTASASADSKSYKEDDRRPYNDGAGPSYARTGPPKKLGPGPLAYPSHGLPLSQPQRLLPPGSVIGYLAYPQPLVHGGLQGGYAPLHDPAVPHAPGLLPSAAFSHIAYASPITFSHYPKPIPLVPGPGYSSSPSYSSGGPSYSSGGPSYSSGGPSYSSGGPSYSSGPHSYN